MDRRDFVQQLPGLAAGVLCAGPVVALGGCAGAPYVRPRVVGETLVVPMADVQGAGGAFVEAPESNRPIFVRRGEDGWLALHARCTHRGCLPEPMVDRLVCPCHGSEFSFQGQVLEGPAERPLRSYEVRQEGSALVIHLDRGVGG